MDLERIRYDAGRLEYSSRHARQPESALAGYLERAREIAGACEARFGRERPEALELAPAFERLRWFAMPHEAAAQLRGGAAPPPPAGRLLRL